MIASCLIQIKRTVPILHRVSTRPYTVLGCRTNILKSRNALPRSPRSDHKSIPTRIPGSTRPFTDQQINISDTIFALSTRPGKSAIALIRVSGSKTKDVIRQMIKQKKPNTNFPHPRQATMCSIVDPQDPTNILDKAICIWFPNPSSYTSEDMLEFHVHGGTAVVSAILNALNEIQGLRMAEPGEFSRRAFDNGKMDLTSIEGIADLINAETEAQRKLAVRQAQGELYKRYTKWRNQIINLMAQIEAFIDFSEEENIEDGVYQTVRVNAHRLLCDIKDHIDDHRRGEILRSGVSLSIFGPPNSGKSTLLNLLANRQIAIVSHLEGTTRDIVETALDIGGYPVVVRDTAGIRNSSDLIEKEGIRRAIESAEKADIRIFMLDSSRVLGRNGENNKSAFAMLDDLEWRKLLDLPDTFILLNKEDKLVGNYRSREALSEQVDEWKAANKINNETHLVSCSTQSGWKSVMDHLAKRIKDNWESGNSQPMPLTKTRHRMHLKKCLEHLEEFERIDEDMVVLAAEELRRASDSLGRITGKIGIEDVLDALFSQFCIGK